jgi:hypothetical protein
MRNKRKTAKEKGRAENVVRYSVPHRTPSRTEHIKSIDKFYKNS